MALDTVGCESDYGDGLFDSDVRVGVIVFKGNRGEQCEDKFFDALQVVRVIASVGHLAQDLAELPVIEKKSGERRYVRISVFYEDFELFGCSAHF